MKEWEKEEWLDRIHDTIGNLPHSDAAEVLLECFLSTAAAMKSQKEDRCVVVPPELPEEVLEFVLPQLD